MATAKRKTSFMESGMKAIRSLRKRKSGYTGQEIRLKLEQTGIVPKSVNQWGPLINKALNEEIITPTDEYRHTILPESRNRLLNVYMR